MAAGVPSSFYRRLLGFAQGAYANVSQLPVLADRQGGGAIRAMSAGGKSFPLNARFSSVAPVAADEFLIDITGPGEFAGGNVILELQGGPLYGALNPAAFSAVGDIVFVGSGYSGTGFSTIVGIHNLVSAPAANPTAIDNVVYGNENNCAGMETSVVIGRLNEVPITDASGAHIFGSSHRYESNSTGYLFGGAMNMPAGAPLNMIAVGVGGENLAIDPTSGGLYFGRATNPLKITMPTTGARRAAGTATLVGGAVVIATQRVTANTLVLFAAQDNSGAAGHLYVSARTAGTSFTVTSTSGTDTRTIAWLLIEPGESPVGAIA